MPYKSRKVLIIKMGYTETLIREKKCSLIKQESSYGDVLRSTVLLHLYKDDQVTWLVDEAACPILKHNLYVDRILIYNLTSVLQLQREEFDIIINLEKISGLCALVDSMNAQDRYGFRFDPQTGEADAYHGSCKALEMCTAHKKNMEIKKTWQEVLFQMVGATWNGEEYVFGFKSDIHDQYDIGFNHQIGNKWPLKAWPRNYWKELEHLIGDTYSISWQQGLDNMEEYFKWIDSCKVLITNDSFGLHLAIALKKKIIALFGPTEKDETFLYSLGRRLYAKESYCPVQPCAGLLEKCLLYEDSCMRRLRPQDVYDELKLLSETKTRAETYV